MHGDDELVKGLGQMLPYMLGKDSPIARVVVEGWSQKEAQWTEL